MPITKEVKRLAKRYIQEGIFPKKKEADAQHVAVASVNNLDFILSWNFEHIVKIETKRKVKAVNTLLDYPTPETAVPEEVIYSG